MYTLCKNEPIKCANGVQMIESIMEMWFLLLFIFGKYFFKGFWVQQVMDYIF